MLNMLPADGQSPYLPDILALYRAAFPANERRPLDALLNDKSGAGEVFAVLDGDTFIGLVILLTHGDITHILYFAVVEALRGRGYGAEILAAIRRRYPKQRILADLEAPDENADNHQQRARRIDFYLRNGYARTDIGYTWIGERYVILCAGGSITGREFGDFWEYFYNLDEGYDY